MDKEKMILKLKKENKALKETCEILSDKKVMADIRQSLKEIKQGKYIKASDL